jgi:hypothetical protein
MAKMAKRTANFSASFSNEVKEALNSLPSGTRVGVLEKLVLICVPIIRQEGTPATLADIEAMRSLLERELGGKKAIMDNPAAQQPLNIEQKSKSRDGLKEIF